MTDQTDDRTILSRLVGSWRGTLLYRADADGPFEEMIGTSENRWVLGGRFVEIALRAGDVWSAIFYIGHERTERRHVLVSLEPGGRRGMPRLGDWLTDGGRLILTSSQSRVICDTTNPGLLTLRLAETAAGGHEFVRFEADYRPVVAIAPKPAVSRPQRRFVIA